MIDKLSKENKIHVSQIIRYFAIVQTVTQSERDSIADDSGIR